MDLEHELEKNAGDLVNELDRGAQNGDLDRDLDQMGFAVVFPN